MSQAVQDMFGRIAHRYDLVNRLLSAKRDVAWRRKALSFLPQPAGVVLDLATGTGDLGAEALQAGLAQRVHGADFCVPMLSAGSSRRERSGPFSATAADALSLPYADGVFDAAMIAYGWRNFDDPAAALGELRRVLKPGGTLIILEFFRPERLWTRLFHRLFSAVAPVMGALFAGNGAAYAYLHRSIQGFLSVTEADHLLTQGGFGNLRWHSCFGGVSHVVAAVSAPPPQDCAPSAEDVAPC
ncbi:MAG: ubiquinone/menaquinone biosynthesis methyltransferase [Planctomycetota bacterium]|nr:MAG: ubiquinone/menaquinone biosynthesis methyltransferase [Planctomycetota bacterium]